MSEIDNIVNELTSCIEGLRLNTCNKKETKCKIKYMTKLELFKKLGGFNPITHTTRWVNINEFVGEFSTLYQKNGGLGRGWDRWYKILKVKNDRTIVWTWEPTKEEEENILSNLDTYLKLKKIYFPVQGTPSAHLLIKICGQQNKNINRPIRKDIRNFYSKEPCSVCANISNLVCDHKNDLYNNPRVLDTKTQLFSDFQSLCNHCNLQKRQIAKITKRTGLRWKATNIPHMKHWGVDFTRGGEQYDPNDPDAMVGTYWYDPIQFHKDVLRIVFKRTNSTDQRSIQFSSSCP